MSSNRILQLEDVRILEPPTQARDDDATSTIVSTVCDEINPKVACKRHSMTCFSHSIWTQGIALETSHDVVPVYSLALNRLEEDTWQRIVSALPPAQRVDIINSKPIVCKLRTTACGMVAIFGRSVDGEWQLALQRVSLKDMVAFMRECPPPPEQADNILYVQDSKVRLFYSSCAPDPTDVVFQFEGYFYQNRIGVPICFSKNGTSYPNWAAPMAHTLRIRTILQYIDKQTFNFGNIHTDLRRCARRKRLLDVIAYMEGVQDLSSARELATAAVFSVHHCFDRLPQAYDLIGGVDLHEMVASSVGRDIVRVHMFREIVAAACFRFNIAKGPTIRPILCQLTASVTSRHPIVKKCMVDRMPYKDVPISSSSQVTALSTHDELYFQHRMAWSKELMLACSLSDDTLTYHGDGVIRIGDYTLHNIEMRGLKMPSSSMDQSNGTATWNLAGETVKLTVKRDDGLQLRANGRMQEEDRERLMNLAIQSTPFRALQGSSAIVRIDSTVEISKIVVYIDESSHVHERNVSNIQYLIDENKACVLSRHYDIADTASKRKSDGSWVGICNVFTLKDDQLRELTLKPQFERNTNIFDLAALCGTNGLLDASDQSIFHKWLKEIKVLLQPVFSKHVTRAATTTEALPKPSFHSRLLVDMVLSEFDAIEESPSYDEFIDDDGLRRFFYNDDKQVFREGRESANYKLDTKYDKELIAKLLVRVDEDRRVMHLIGRGIPNFWDMPLARIKSTRMLLRSTNARNEIKAHIATCFARN